MTYTQHDLEFINFVNNKLINKLLIRIDQETKFSGGKTFNIYFELEKSEDDGSTMFKVYYQIFDRQSNMFISEDESSFVYLPANPIDVETPEFCRGRCFGEVSTYLENVVKHLRG